MEYEKPRLLQIGKRKPAIVPAKTLYILVHPFFGATKHPYTDNVKTLIHKCVDPILTLDTIEIYSRIGRFIRFDHDVVVRRYRRLNPQGERYFLGNGIHNSMPSCGWDNTVEVIKSFNPSEVIFGGSQLVGHDDETYAQCLGHAYRVLRHKVVNARLDESICDRVD